MVISGKDRGKTGKITRAFPREERIIVAGINMKKVHKRPTKQRGKGQIVEQAAPFHVSNVQIIDPKTGKPTRVGYKIEKDKKLRIGRKSGMEF